MNWRSLAILAVMVVVPAAMAAQGDSARVLVSGIVVDPLRNPIEGAEVRVVGSSIVVVTPATGAFRFFVPGRREFLVQIRRVGYSAQLLKVTGDWKGQVLLEPGAYKLPEIAVSARYAKPARYSGTNKYDDYFRRRRQGIGQFIDREEIDQRFVTRIADLFQGRAGIRVSLGAPGAGTVVSFARCREQPPKINVYVDGRRLIPQGGDPKPGSSLFGGMGPPSYLVGEMLERVNAADVEFLEVFRGPAELPPEFNDGNCGAIAIWTKQGGR